MADYETAAHAASLIDTAAFLLVAVGVRGRPP
jgi:hypothetical protein